VEPGKLTPERALLRLQQLAREEQRAVAVGDVDLLCRIARLLPATMEMIDRSALPGMPDAPAMIAEIQAAHSAAEAFLTGRMKDVAGTLKRYATARRVVSGYAKRPRRSVDLTTG